MGIQLPRYVSQRRDSYHFQRSIPTRLMHLTSLRFFTMPLGLKVGASERQLYEATDFAQNQFALYCKTLEVSDPNAYADTELNELALKMLRERNASLSEFQQIKVDEFIAAQEELGGYKLQPTATDLASQVIPEIDDVAIKFAAGEPLSLQDKVAKKAYDLLLTPRSKRGRPTLGGLWEDYLSSRGKLESHSYVKKASGRWKRFLSFSGDGYFQEESKGALLDALEDYVQSRRNDGIGESSIRRELAEVVACLNFGAKKHRLTWRVQRPELRQEETKLRHVFTLDEQVAMINFCLSDQPKFGKHSAIISLAFLGGMIPSEIKNIEPTGMFFESETPYVGFSVGGKTAYRRRAVPIVFGVNLLRNHLSDAIKWINETSGSNVSACVNNLIQSITKNSKLTLYSCRHTFRMNATKHSVPVTALNAIGGWKDTYMGSREMLRYGAAALEDSEHIRFLFAESQKIQSHLLEKIA